MVRVKKVKVLYFVNIFSEKSETFIYNLAVGLQSRNVEVLVICLERKNERSKPFSPIIRLKQFKVLQRINRFSSKFYFNGLNIGSFIQIGKILKDFQPDIIHCHFGNQSFNLLDSVFTKIPVIISFHGYDASYFVKRSSTYAKRLKNLFKKNNIYPVFCSQALRENLLQYGISSKTSRIIHYGVKIENDVKAEPSSKKLLLQIGRLVEKKGIIFTLKAIKQVLTENLELSFDFIIAGDGPLRFELEQYVQKEGLDDVVSFIGWVNDIERNKWLNKADVFVQHSVTADDGNMEGLPNTILEAMSYELPILSTLHSGIPEMVENGVNGLLSPERDVLQFATNLRLILKWEKLGINREKVVEHFGLDRYVSSYIDLYREVLS
jgi:colanic acid/amylovoran biosynthesis glycosyltransferase